MIKCTHPTLEDGWWISSIQFDSFRTDWIFCWSDRACKSFLDLPPKQAASDQLIKCNQSNSMAESISKTEIAESVGVGPRQNRKKIREVSTFCQFWDFPTTTGQEVKSRRKSDSASVWQEPGNWPLLVVKNWPQNPKPDFWSRQRGFFHQRSGQKDLMFC